MIITQEKDLESILYGDLWCNDEWKDVLTSEDCEELERQFEMEYPEGIDLTELNDIFRFESDYIAQMLGFDDFEDLGNNRKEHNLA
jgi:hypothetical protein